MEHATQQTLLIVEADLADQRLMQLTFAAHGYRVYSVASGYGGLRHLFKGKPDLALVSLSLPDFSGEKFCRRLRNFTNIPLIFLAETREVAADHLLPDCGLTDVIGRPLDMAAMLERIRLFLARAQPNGQSPTPAVTENSTAGNSIAGNLAELATIPIIDHARRQILVNGKCTRLSAIEYRLLSYLLEHAGQVLSHRQLAGALWDDAAIDHANQLYYLVWRLRHKLGEHPKAPRHLLSEYGMGYRFDSGEVISWYD